MTDVFVVWAYDYDAGEPLAVFTTREKAEAFAELLRSKRQGNYRFQVDNVPLDPKEGVEGTPPAAELDIIKRDYPHLAELLGDEQRG
jgi:hypothetical protein